MGKKNNIQSQESSNILISSKLIEIKNSETFFSPISQLDITSRDWPKGWKSRKMAYTAHEGK